MRLLVDAHTLLWWLGDDQRLSDTARSAIGHAEDPRVGVGTLAEIAIKRSLGKLEIAEDWPEQTQADGFRLLAIGWGHAARLQALPFPLIAGKLHRDPFDRLLAAQALSESLPIVTRDPALTAYGAVTIW
jgi:PIN domain nuclease of toxin-antitoxin system